MSAVFSVCMASATQAVATRYDNRDNRFRLDPDLAPRPPMPVRRSEVANQLNGIVEGELGLVGQ